MGRTLTPLRALVALLCVGLSLVFAGASAASVLDRYQHDSHVSHDHGVHLTLTADTDHHDHHADHDQEIPDGKADAGDHQPGATHHHHSDAPTGVIATVEAAPVTLAVVTDLSPPEAINRGGIRPGGLERPPRRNGQRV